MATPENSPTDNKKDRWELWNVRAEVIHKVGILIIGTAVAAVFYYFQEQQLRTRYFADLMAQRESADSQLRATMFNTLFNAYFDKTIASRETASRAATPVDAVLTSPAVGTQHGAWAARIKQETIFADLIARNFEDIDVRPLLEDLDSQLSGIVGSVPQLGSLPLTPDQHEAFALRERLRRAAIGASARQRTSLVGGAHATSTIGQVLRCEGKPIDSDNRRPFENVYAYVDHVEEGHVAMRVIPTVEGANSVDLDVSFYDMPALENLVVADGSNGQQRIAFSLIRYVSHDACARFKNDMDAVTQGHCDDLPQDQPNCDVAVLQAITFPKDYIARSDRPYLNDLIEGKFASGK